MNRTILILLLGILFSSAKAQPFAKDRAFADHLIDEGLYEECILFLSDLKTKNQISSNQLDTITYYTGLCHFKEERWLDAQLSFNEITRRSVLSFNTRMIESGIDAKLGQYDLGSSRLSSLLNVTESNSLGQVYYGLASFSLLKRDYESFSEFYSQIGEKEREKPFVSRLPEYHGMLMRAKKRSPLAAGALSAVIPGAGRVYAGKTKEGVMSFFPVAILALQTVEAYVKDGWKNPRFIVFGGAFTIFYIGNIWGSVLSIKIRKQEIYDEVDHQILMDMEIPLRSLIPSGGN